MKRAVLSIIACATVFQLPAYSACNCMQTPEQKALLAKQQLAYSRLASQADFELAQQMENNSLTADAQTYYKSALSKAEAEITAQQSAAFDLKLHKVAIERAYANLLRKTGQYGSAAGHLESALTTELSIGKDKDSEDKWGQIAALYVLAGDHAKAAAVHKRLLAIQQSKKGRYSPAAVHAAATYSQSLKHAGKN